ncbi:ferredoxin [Sporanaerobium hydrogeniformans]|uniref:Ferredoxin n=1 Tax=Sporanaerobium hydrogeniformans TaxID=3072179 RepID=A0AC61DG70_9FIRM|nr:[FeFe] hydrogenase, group A [Sporanaerobium hydrogeniformans]PHV72249.1 ferredoxin [Sporanaerobium hydrogeniformans]
MRAEFMMIDDIPVEIQGEKNVLELIRKAGIDLPTFCYYSELSVYGACRLCVVENKWGGIEASCSTIPKAGMEVYTNTPRLRKYRKMILELILANHCRDCTTCEKSGTCKLQELAMRFGIKEVRFENTKKDLPMDTSSCCIVRDETKCILCGDCVRMCDEVQNVGAIDFVHRGSEMRIGTAFHQCMAKSNCVGCGQCAAVCPTGAIVVKNDTASIWKELGDPQAKVVVQIAPAVRVAIDEALGQKNGKNVMGKIVAVLRRMGFNEIFDTSTGADLTVLEETNEFLKRLEKNERLPLFTSCCPAWIKYAENKHPDLLQNISTCRSPMEMFGAVLKEHYKHSNKRVVVVAIMPCTAKKAEAARDEFKVEGTPYVDYVLTTQELIQMVRESGLVFDEMEPEAVDMPFGAPSGAGVIFGVTGGVTEAVIRRVADDKSINMLRTLAFKGVRGMEGVKETSIPFGEQTLHIAVVSGLANAEVLIQQIKSGEKHYDLIEVMACPGGCIGGAGQPFADREQKAKRGQGLYETDRMSSIKRAEENPVILSLYQGLLKGKVHELLHVEYKGKGQKS